ncbi:hypothetical protein ABIC84_005064 [Mucilaginibacter sp. 3215]
MHSLLLYALYFILMSVRINFFVNWFDKILALGGGFLYYDFFKL